MDNYYKHEYNESVNKNCVGTKRENVERKR